MKTSSLELVASPLNHGYARLDGLGCACAAAASLGSGCGLLRDLAVQIFECEERVVAEA
jgi:hypothetical protein